MPNLLLLFNHTITNAQRKDSVRQLGIERIIEPPPDIRAVWSALPPEEENLVPVLEPVVDWLDSTASAGDYVLVQGDFGACWLLVNHCLRRGFIPVYSTTRRHAVEEHLDDGTVRLVHRFSHVRFRKYGQ